jgi:glycosyltransferase involved in cell wall biosynthesis
MNRSTRERIPVLYLAPWVDYGGSDKNTIDWFRWIDRDRFAPSLITTQPSPNRLLTEVAPFAEEVWALPDLMPAEDMPEFIFDFLHSRDVRVLHLMNSRLGFELLPDLACLPRPPATVVQLHVEEADRSGYVRYVTTRYGNLVDRFSVSNRHVADAAEGYGIPAERVRVIYTGVDPDDEFSPDRAEPIEDLPEDRLQILFAARLVAQKDPLLMLEVAAALRNRGVSFQIHVVGEGDLEGEIRDRIAAQGLSEHVQLHPPTPGLQRWYAACDVLLMTSAFEGIPCVVFEAMAMGLPIVAPDLPAIGELLGETEDALVSPRDSVQGYASALAHLAEDRARMEAHGAQMRARARAQFTVQQMADGHGELYGELIDAAPPAPADDEDTRPTPAPIRFTGRPRTGTPLVSVLVPHFNQAPFLGECIDSIRKQTYPEIEVVVVDDASTDRDADAALSELEESGDATVLRLPENGGPSHARNVGLEHCSGRYILPVDADNLLLPDAVERLVGQLSAADETVGFIYPNLQYFGNREDYYEVPEYNLYTLLHGNFCDTCSLLDREIFDAGERYMEELRLGHEDWEFVLRLAARNVRGEAAQGPTVLYRKWGFNRSDAVDHAADRFDEVLAEISPFKGREAEIKASESPALSIVALRQPNAGSKEGHTLAARLAAQTCADLELIAEDELREAVGLARGSYMALTSGSGGPLLGDPAFCEKVLRRFVASDNDVDAIVLIDAGEDGRFPFHALSAEDGPADAVPHSVLWRRTAELELPRGLLADPGDPVASVARLLSGAGLRVEWRHASGEGEGARPRGAWVELPASPASSEDPHDLRPGAKPLLPGAGEYRVPRWKDTPTWVPALSTIAMRYREDHGARRLVTNGPAPAGFTLEHHLGALRCTSFEGTVRLVRAGDDYKTISRGEWDSAPEDAEDLGYAELAGFPQMDVLAIAVHRETGQRVLVSLTDEDLLRDRVDVIEIVGHVEPFPARPRRTPQAERTLGLVGLTRAVDHEARRHRYALGEFPDGQPLAELGGLAESERQGDVGAWIANGYLVTQRHKPPSGRSRPIAVARWTAEPAAWRGLASPAARAKVTVRRATIAAARLARPARPVADPGGEPEAWLFDSGRPGRAPLFAAYHPVTGDQLLTRSAEDAAHLGYGPPELLGYMRSLAPVTGNLGLHPLPIPWARRFGAVPLSG